MKFINLTRFAPGCLFLILFNCSHVSDTPTQNVSEHKYILNENILWANPEGFPLTMDIYTPTTGQESYPVLVIIHGGGWLINDKSPMTAMSDYIAKHANYVICNINYRLLIDKNNTVTMDEIIEDAMGSVLWVKANISGYKGDPEKIIITGDSAGGHLAAMILLAGNQLKSDGFSGSTPGYNPTWLPEGKTAEMISAEGGLTVQGAILSYAAFDMVEACQAGGLESANNIFWTMAGATARGIFGPDISLEDNPEFYLAVSPIHLIPHASEQTLPPILCTAGSIDFVVPPASVEAFVDSMREKGHEVDYWIHEGRNHAFLDGGSNVFLGTEFTRDGIPALVKMIEFMDHLFYNSPAN
jgi:acetyl esterase